MNTIYNLTLSMFDGGAGAGAGAAGAAATGTASPAGEGAAPDAAAPKTGKEEAKIVYGKAPDEPAPVQAAEPMEAQAEPEAVDPDAEFDQLIAGKHKDQFSKKIEAIINKRFKDYKALENKVTKLTPSMKLLAERYKVDPENDDALATAIQNDDSFYEDAAIQSGMTVEAYKEVQRAKRYNEQYEAAEAQRLKKEHMEAAIQKQVEDAKQLKQTYPKFDLKTELANPAFMQLVHPDNPYALDVATAYKVVHHDDMQKETIQYTAQRAQKETADDIRARGQRPAENGLGGQAAAVIRKADPNTWTRQDRDEVEKRIMRGETIR
ncbi:MAG: hypothetical protein WC047_00025 [Kiritimatiellales bacterium]